MSEFNKMKMYITRCLQQERKITDFDMLHTLVLIMEKIDAIEKAQKENSNQKEKTYEKGLAHFEQTKEEPKGLTREEFDEQVRLLHAQRDF
jgi:RPA family protein